MPIPGYHMSPFSQEHIEQMLAACDRTTSRGQRDYTILLLLSQTGIRVSELCRLRVQDIQGTAIHVVGKTTTRRDVEVSQEVSRQLKIYMNGCRRATSGNEAVFMDDKGQPLTPVTASQWFTEVKKHAGIEGDGWSIHTFRHTFAAQLYRPSKSS